MNRYRYDDCKHGCITKVLKLYQSGMPLSKAVFKQASKFPKGLKQYWADVIWLGCLYRIRDNKLPKKR